MTDTNLLGKLVDEETRRSFLKKGAFATAGASLASGSAAAQAEGDDGLGAGDDEDDVVDEQFRGVVFQNNFRPDANFVITSPVLDWTPDVPADIGGPLTAFNTRMITYMNTGERVPLFVSQDAENVDYVDDYGYVPDNDQEFAEDEWVQPEVFEMDNQYSAFGQTNRLLTVQVNPLEEDVEDDVLSDFESQDEFNDFLF